LGLPQIYPPQEESVGKSASIYHGVTRTCPQCYSVAGGGTACPSVGQGVNFGIEYLSIAYIPILAR